MKKRVVSLVLMTAVLLLALTGCAGSREESSASLHMVLLAPYVLEENATALEQELVNALPALNTETAKLQLTCISAGDADTDPYSTMAAVTRMGGMMASKEVELLICDEENARRYAENGEAFVPLTELFTEAEIDEWGIVPAYVPLSDDEGNLTGDMSAACGVDLSGCTALEDMMKLSDLSAYVIVDSANLDNAKAVMTHLTGMK